MHQIRLNVNTSTANTFVDIRRVIDLGYPYRLERVVTIF